MALSAVQTAMNWEDKKTIHPFFVRPQGDPSPDRNLNPNDDGDAEYEEPKTGTKGRKRRAQEAPREVRDKRTGQMNQASLESFTRRANGGGAPEHESATFAKHQDAPIDSTMEEDPNQGRKKRRKMASPKLPSSGQHTEADPIRRTEGLDWFRQLQLEAEKGSAGQGQDSRDISTDGQLGVGESSSREKHNSGVPDSIPSGDLVPNMDHTNHVHPHVESHNGEDDTLKRTPPKPKVLKVNKNGKLISPKSTKPEKEISASPKRKRTQKTSKAKSSLIVVIKYGLDAGSRRRIGQRIDDVMGVKNIPTELKTAPCTAAFKSIPPKVAGPPKPTHPFFLGKVVQKEDIQVEEPKDDTTTAPRPRTPRKTAVTPGKLKTEIRCNQVSQPPSVPAFGPLGGKGWSTKADGLKEAPWPPKDSAHVRNIEVEEVQEGPAKSGRTDILFKPRKLKRRAVGVPQYEDLIFCLAQELKATRHITHQESNVRIDGIENVRLPRRLLTTGFDLQERLRKELKAPLSPSGERRSIHPAISKLFKDIDQTLTPFDKGECETQSWVQKYAPHCASQVLQSGKEAVVLRDWLLNLTVKAVQSSTDGNNAATIPESRRPVKKKRKKLEDDFIISSDEDDDELIEFSDGDQYGPSDWEPSRQRSLKRPRMSRNKNVIILSGPHGCGKSATVYAVAKELGFEVFEINSGSRRSGKDIQDKVGDMSENHLVHHRHGDTATSHDPLPAEDADSERMSKAFEEDLQSGRQGTMMSFFKSNPPARANPKSKPKTKAAQKPSSSVQVTLGDVRKPQNLQKQSLILFEEADILFEEDQQFWLQVTKLASQSKRPIVITCNDENLIPAYGLPSGAILRLAPPPVALATDYLLTLAAKEGHVLERNAVSDLYKSKNRDLRASITDLDFWCQMSVGDRKGGLEWMYQRWPPGKDVDESGRIFRIASEGTYQSGMGLIPFDILAAEDKPGFDKEEELLKAVWADWGVGPNRFMDYMMPSDGPSSNPRSPASHLTDLERLEHMLDAVSDADNYCQVGLPSYDCYWEEPTDPSLPPIPDKERLNYTSDATFLQVDHVSDFGDLDMKISVQSHLSLKRMVGGGQASDKGGVVADESPNQDRLIQQILQQKRDGLKRQSLSWVDFSAAFDILATPPATTLALSTSFQLTPSSFDRTLRIVVEDLAPFVRSIVSHELRLEAERIRLSNLLSEGGRGKRLRMTRASRVALEGGTRQSKRRERWFEKDLNRALVMGTAGKSWSGLGSMTEETDISTRTGDSVAGADDE